MPKFDGTIWNFALVFYQQPGVEADCLAAQDKYNLDVTVLIFALHRTLMGQGFEAVAAVKIARRLSETVIEPLRAARVSLKTPPALVDRTNSAALRQQVQTAELAAERLTLEALARLPFDEAFPSAEAALLAISSARWPTIPADLVALLKRLALAAQNM